MLAYKKLFEDMRSTGKVTKESWKFVEPEGLSDDELSGIYKQMIELSLIHIYTPIFYVFQVA